MVGFVGLGVGLGVELRVELGVRGGVVFDSVLVSCPGVGFLPWLPTLEQLDPSPLHTPHLSKRALESTEPSHPIVLHCPLIQTPLLGVSEHGVPSLTFPNVVVVVVNPSVTAHFNTHFGES